MFLLGSPLSVNVETAGDQSEPTVAALSDGTFVVGWTDEATASSLQGRAYKSNGAAAGGQFDIASAHSAVVDEPDLAAGINADFLVAFELTDSTDETDLKLQAMLDGEAVDGAAGFASASGGFAADVELITLAPASGYAAVYSAFESSSTSVQIQVFDQNGGPAGSFAILGGDPEFPGPSNPAVTPLGDDEFLVSWDVFVVRGITPGGIIVGDTDVRVQLFDADTGADGPIITAGTSAGDQGRSDVAALDGNFVASWVDLGTGTIRGQVYELDGSSVGAEIVIDESALGAPQVVALDTGGFALVFAVDTGRGIDILAQQFDAGGAAVGAALPIGDATGIAAVDFSLDVAALTGGRLVVTWADAADGSGASVSAQLVAAGDVPSAFNHAGSWTDANAGSGPWTVGDFNGDGRADVFSAGDGARSADVLLSTGAAFAAPVRWLTASGGADGWRVGDFDGDGKDDLLRDSPRSGAQVFLSDGGAFEEAESWSGRRAPGEGWQVGDFNGDGTDDVFRTTPGGLGAQVFLSNGDDFVRQGWWTTADDGADGWYVGDFNGDGLDDIFRYVPGVSGADVFLSNGSEFVASGSWTSAGHGADGWYVGDFNGDGVDDIFRYVDGVSGAQAYLSDGDGFASAGSWTSAGDGSDGWYVGDYDGDGVDDILRRLPGESGADVLLA